MTRGRPVDLHVVSLPAWRSRTIMGLFLVAFAIAAGRAFWLQTMNDDFLKKEGDIRHIRKVSTPEPRGRIRDRNDVDLAISVEVKSVWIAKNMFSPTDEEFEELARALRMSRRQIETRLASAEVKPYAAIQLQASDEVVANVTNLLAKSKAEHAQLLGRLRKTKSQEEPPAYHRFQGVMIQEGFRRFYPEGEAMAHVLGTTDAYDKGQEGVEAAFQKQLTGSRTTRRVVQDMKGHVIDHVGGVDLDPPATARTPTSHITLALDSRVQHLAAGALRSAIAEHKAKAGAVVVIDSTTGELVAMANWPTFNPNNREAINHAERRNRALVDTFEPGSTLKPFTIAVGLESGRYTAQTPIPTAPGAMTIGTATIRDAHPAGTLSVAEVIQKSSNVGSAKIALSMPPESMYFMFEQVGFGARVNMPFPGLVSGRLRPANKWRPIEQATMAYGHGISLSLAHLARGYMIFARDGDLLPISLLRVGERPESTRVISPKTAQDVRRMLEMAVQQGGTAPRAQIMGYRVAGKTGTARKLENGQYTHDKHVASFVGFAPVSNPRLIVAVMIDEPRAGQVYGGLVAAPVFAEIMSGSLRHLGVPYDAPLKPVQLPPPGTELKEST